jgi:hypothetical protein
MFIVHETHNKPQNHQRRISYPIIPSPYYQCPNETTTTTTTTTRITNIIPFQHHFINVRMKQITRSKQRYLIYIVTKHHQPRLMLIHFSFIPPQTCTFSLPCMYVCMYVCVPKPQQRPPIQFNSIQFHSSSHIIRILFDSNFARSIVILHVIVIPYS